MFQYLYAIAKKLNAIYHPDLTYDAFPCFFLNVILSVVGFNVNCTVQLSKFDNWLVQKSGEIVNTESVVRTRLINLICAFFKYKFVVVVGKIYPRN